MSVSYIAAVDDIYSLFYQYWQTEASGVVGYIPAIAWDNQKSPLPNNLHFKDKYWLRVSQQTVTEEQSTLSTCEGEPGKKLYQVDGLVFVQLFCPIHDKDATQNGRILADLAKKAFRGKQTQSGIWFRNVRINELSPENLFIRFNVVCEYQYNEKG